MTKAVRDPFTIILRHKKLPYGLIDNNTTKINRMNLLQIEKFDDTFGPKARRKRPKLRALNLERFAERADQSSSFVSLLLLFLVVFASGRGSLVAF